MKKQLVISGIVGGIIGSMLTALLVSPVTAQRNKFRKIECTTLRVSDENLWGNIFIAPYGVYFYDNNSNVRMVIDTPSQIVEVEGADGKSKAALGVSEHGGFVRVEGKDGKSKATLNISEHGGHVEVHGRGEGAAVMDINEDGNGGVSTWDKNGYRQ